MTLNLTTLGSSGTYACPDDACSGYLIECGGYRLVLDLGPGCLANLQRHCALVDIDAVVISHVHGDHWLDLALLKTANEHIIGRVGTRVIGSAEVLTAAEGLMRSPIAPTFDWSCATDGSEVELGPLAVRFSQTDHPGETLAVRIEGAGRSISYSADTGPQWHLSELGTSTDLALVEATYCDEDIALADGIHLTSSQAGLMARQAGAQRLVVTHVLPTTDRDVVRAEAAAQFGGSVDMASPNRTISV